MKYETVTFEYDPTPRKVSGGAYLVAFVSRDAGPELMLLLSLN